MPLLILTDGPPISDWFSSLLLLWGAKLERIVWLTYWAQDYYKFSRETETRMGSLWSRRDAKQFKCTGRESRSGLGERGWQPRASSVAVTTPFSLQSPVCKCTTERHSGIAHAPKAIDSLPAIPIPATYAGFAIHTPDKLSGHKRWGF